MKIAFLIDGFDIGGTELNAARTLESFARRGLAVDVFHFHADGPLRTRIAAAGHRLWHIPVVSLKSPRIVLRIASLAAAIRRSGATVIHTQDVYTNILGVAAARVLLRRPVLTSRRWKDDVPRKELTPLNAWAHRNSTLVLPNSPALIASLHREGVLDARIFVHENFIDARLPAQLIGDQRTWQLPALRFTIGQLVQTLAKMFGENRASLVLYEPNEQVEAGFGRFPPLDASSSEVLGFHHDGDIETLVRNALV